METDHEGVKFEDDFEIMEKDPDGKKFDRGECLHATTRCVGEIEGRSPPPQPHLLSRAGKRGGDRGVPARASPLETRSTPRFEVDLPGPDPDPSFKLRSPRSLEVHLPQRAVRHGFDAGRQCRDLSFGS